MRFRRRNSEAPADLVCGNLGAYEPAAGENPKYFPCRSSSYITEFFSELDTNWVHDGSTRHRWVADVLDSMLAEAHDGPTHPPEIICRLIDHLMSPSDAPNEGPDRHHALEQLNEVLAREGFEPSTPTTGTATCVTPAPTPSPRAGQPAPPAHSRPRATRHDLAAYLDQCSEDDLTEEVLLPLFRQLGFHRITAAGHKDQALEYGKDLWMRYTLPTQHLL